MDWFTLRDGRHERMTLTANGIYKSDVFPGLWLDPAALIRGDLATAAKIVQEGVTQPDHAAFVERLRAAAGGPALSKAPPRRRKPRKRRGTIE